MYRDGPGPISHAERQEGPCDEAFLPFLRQVEPIMMREPLAAVLGAFTDPEAPGGDTLEYRFTDAVKMAGHCCPTVSGAYLICLLALKELYVGETPVRGEIAVTAYGGADEAVYGVMSQVISLITGAAAATGFKGLAGRFVRKGLLDFSTEKPDPAAMAFQFRRMDPGAADGASVLAKFLPWAVPFPEGKSRRSGELLPGVAAGTATPDETREFRDLWMEKIHAMLIERREIGNWLKIEKR
jgi:hypothetical protein